MRSSNNDITNEYTSVAQKFSKCLASIAVEYIVSSNAPSNVRAALFSHGLVKSLLSDSEIFEYLHKRYRQDLIDSLTTHITKYIQLLEQDPEYSKFSTAFQQDVDNLIGRLSDNKLAHVSDMTDPELTVVQDAALEIIQKCRTLFAEQSHTVDIIEILQVMSVAFAIKSLDAHQHHDLKNKLLLIKELLSCNYKSNDAIKELLAHFYSNLTYFLQDITSSDVDNACADIINVVMQDHKLLQHITDLGLVDLYDKLKDVASNEYDIFDDLLHKIYQEAQFRYNCTKLNDDSYALLTRFQTYDEILNQIENSEFGAAEAFLLHNNNFAQEVLSITSKHIDNIRAIGGWKMPIIHNILNKLEAELSHYSTSKQDYTEIIDDIKAKFAVTADAQLMKRYTELSKFTIKALKEKYTQLFESVKLLFDENQHQENNAFLSRVFIRKIAQDYYICNASSSVATLRKIVCDRNEIVSQLSEIDLLEIFNSAHANKIQTLSFKKTNCL